MAYRNVKALRRQTQQPPIVQEIRAIFAELSEHDGELLDALRGPRRRGRPGYDPEILWHCFVAYYFLGLPSVSELIRRLQDNPYIARACGVKSPEEIPSQPTFSRFFAKLSERIMRGRVNRVFQSLNRKFYKVLPGYGKSVAIDSTDIKAWSNGSHREPTDKDAGWIVKQDTNGHGKFTWGYKLHLLVDTTYELPMAWRVTSGDTADVKAASPLICQARWITDKFHPQHVIADAGYCCEALRRQIRRQFKSIPVIKANAGHKRAVEKYPEDAGWEEIFSRRTSIERVNARLKAHRKLNSLRVRGIGKVRVHCLLSVIALQAQVLATRRRASVRRIIGLKWPTRQVLQG